MYPLTKIVQFVDWSTVIQIELTTCSDCILFNLKYQLDLLFPYLLPVIYQLQLFSTWGDPYYVGLNGLEVYDESGNKIDLLENSKQFNIFLLTRINEHDICQYRGCWLQCDLYILRGKRSFFLQLCAIANLFVEWTSESIACPTDIFLVNHNTVLSLYTIHVVIFCVTGIAAYPDSVNVLENVSNDTRTPDKLINGINDTTDGRNMWLAPMLPGLVSTVL